MGPIMAPVIALQGRSSMFKMVICYFSNIEQHPSIEVDNLIKQSKAFLFLSGAHWWEEGTQCRPKLCRDTSSIHANCTSVGVIFDCVAILVISCLAVLMAKFQ